MSRCAYFVTQEERFPGNHDQKHTSREPCLPQTHVNDISENPTDSGRARFVIGYSLPPSTASERVSVRAKQPSSSTVGHMKRSPIKIQPLVGSTTLTYHQASNRHVMLPSPQHEAMLHGLPYQGIVLTLLPFLPSPHSCIKWSASIWRGYDLLFFANLVIHSTDKLLFTWKHQWWARSA